MREAGRELMEVCVRAGGTITGEHGVGLDKRELLPLVFSDEDMNAMLRVRAAFDPLGLCNPGKIVPLLRGCGEAKAAVQTAGAAASTVTQVASLPAAMSDATQLRTPVQFNSDRAVTSLGRIVVMRTSHRRMETTTVAPASAEEICEILKLASHERWTCIACGRRDVAQAS